ncbi:hypothetical protein ACFOWZ_05480 [Lentzea rhizosphaerae]|uniref:Uncharacterized protein n=1 Tax=Lentzea rhizosphaerae TaxID=2041025 RepID=A0ABV8BL38_9PSEU
MDIVILLGVLVACEFGLRALGHPTRWGTRAAMVLMVGSYYLFISPVLRQDESMSWAVLPGLLAFLVARSAFVRRWRADERAHQERLDGQASQVRDDLAGGRPVRRFALWLRPFHSTERLPTQAASFQGVATQHIDLERMLREALSPDLPLVALGLPGETTGAGRIATDDATWWEEFTRLATAAHQIFVLPAANDGTFREVAWLKDGDQFGKCVFVMPETPPTGGRVHIRRGPRPFVMHHVPQPVIDHRALWGKAAQRLGALEVELPPYDRRGALFRPAGGLVPLALSPVVRKVRRLRALLAALDALDAPCSPPPAHPGPPPYWTSKS